MAAKSVLQTQHRTDKNECHIYPTQKLCPDGVVCTGSVVAYDGTEYSYDAMEQTLYEFQVKDLGPTTKPKSEGDP